MRQLFTDRQTVAIQVGVTLTALAAAVYLSYRWGVAPSWASGGVLGGVAWVAVLWFIAGSVVGIGMYALNLVFYRIQVYRHGYPHEQVEDLE